MNPVVRLVSVRVLCAALAWISWGAPTFAQGTAADPAAKLAAIVKRFDAQQDEYFAAYGAAQTDAQRAAAGAKRPGQEYVAEIRALAQSAAGTDAALEAWIWIIRIGPDCGQAEAAREALAVAVKDYIQSPKLTELPTELRYAGDSLGVEAVEKALRAIVAGSPHDAAKASALFTLAAILSSDRETNSPKVKEARQLFDRLIRDYGEAKTNRGRTYRTVAESFLFELDHLQVGMVAPDFDAVDENGVAFKLSDYRGQVVVLDFWGFW